VPLPFSRAMVNLIAKAGSNSVGGKALLALTRLSIEAISQSALATRAWGSIAILPCFRKHAGPVETRVAGGRSYSYHIASHHNWCIAV